MQRNIPISGMNNFRDIGGYLTGEGKTVRWGKLYRSDHIFNADKNGLEQLKTLNIHTIIDYRSQNEVEKYPNPVFDETVVTYHLDPDAHTAELAAQFSSSIDAEDENLVRKVIQQKEKGLLTQRDSAVLDQYRNFIYKDNSRQAFAKMLQVAACPGAAAIVQHCRGGKDRTGFGVILLLGILGVKREDLVADYMLTQENRRERNAYKMDIYRTYTDDEVVLEYLLSFIDTKPDFIEASINEIERNYGSITAYAMKELGVTEMMVKTMKELYLE